MGQDNPNQTCYIKDGVLERLGIDFFLKKRVKRKQNKAPITLARCYTNPVRLCADDLQILVMNLDNLNGLSLNIIDAQIPTVILEKVDGVPADITVGTCEHQVSRGQKRFFFWWVKGHCVPISNFEPAQMAVCAGGCSSASTTGRWLGNPSSHIFLE